MHALVFAFVSALAAAPAHALPADSYAASSKLSRGNWAKIEVQETGVQFVSNAVLRSLGFHDPAKVNIYGFGGNMLSESLDASTPDDLPCLPSVRTPSGIIFFGVGVTSWKLDKTSSHTYSHTSNPYSQNSYYFISDADSEQAEAAQAPALSPAEGDAITTFTERLVHEQDLISPGSSGRLLLGEDFRAQPQRNFTFSLPGNTGDASLRVVFGAKVTNGSSSIIISANGERLPSTESDKIPGVGSSDTFVALRTSVKRAENPGDKLNLSIQYSHTGALFTAALDYIEAEYTRELRMLDNNLYFYLSPVSDSRVKVEGCNEGTVIWDVTDPVKPLQVAYTLEGSSAIFTAAAGYREYAAFNPAFSSRQAKAAGKIANQDIHGMEAPDMLIISPDSYKEAATRIAALHEKTDGMRVAMLTPEAIYNEFSSGVPDVTAFRRLLKMWYDRAGDTGYTRYCLLLGRATYDNKLATAVVKRSRYPRIPIWQSPDGLTLSSSYSTDDYIGMLADNAGRLNMGAETIHVAVGRMPVKSVAEANSAVAKLEKYVLNPKLGAWRNNVMVIADDQDNGDHLLQAERVVTALRENGNGSGFSYEKLYLDSYPLRHTSTGDSYPEAKQRMMEKIAEGVSFLNYIGHANAREWGHEGLLTWTDIMALNNANTPFIYAATCEFLNWDADDTSGAEELWLKPDAGVIGMICPSRKVLISLNGVLNYNTARHVYRRASDGGSMRVGDIMTAGKNDTKGDANKLRYGLLGDPAMRIPSPVLNVTVDMIAGTDLAASDDMPELKARSRAKIAGRVTDGEGNTLEDFDGSVQIQLYDAEKAIETYGNGKDGKVLTYNDRKTRLFIGKAAAKGGRWETELLLPSEIENNYSPALLSLYACDDTGREANGASERLYVYGYDENAEEDTEGPEITEFYLNSPAFSDGSSVSPSPVVYATFSDISGINVSEAGIGHNMSLTLDGSKVYGDVAIYYSPDAASIEKGSIAYPLSGIEPGDHKLSLTVWDNANNSSESTLSFSVRADWKPGITSLSTDVNPASSSVNFLVDTDGMTEASRLRVDVFDLAGRKVWSGESGAASAGTSSMSMTWDLRDYSRCRVARGIYLYRATIITAEGAEISKTRKLAVTAP